MAITGEPNFRTLLRLSSLRGRIAIYDDGCRRVGHIRLGTPQEDVTDIPLPTYFCSNLAQSPRQIRPKTSPAFIRPSSAPTSTKIAPWDPSQPPLPKQPAITCGKRKFLRNQSAIVGRVDYNHRILMNESPSFYSRLAALIEQDAAYRQFHQSQSRRGVFRLVKSSFDDMLTLLRSFQAKIAVPSASGPPQALLRSGKAFAYYEYKLFTWLSVWLIQRQGITYQQIPNVSLEVLEKVFTNKDPLLLRFEFFLVLALLRKQSCQWGTRESRAVQAEVAEQLSASALTVPNWKAVSFSLFRKNFLRTPHECRERWINHLDPSISKRKWTPEEDLRMLSLYRQQGAKWSLLARLISNRNEHMIKNRFNSLRSRWVKLHPGQEKKFRVDLLIEELRSNGVKEEAGTVRREEGDESEELKGKMKRRRTRRELAAKNGQTLNKSSHNKPQKENSLFSGQTVQHEYQQPSTQPPKAIQPTHWTFPEQPYPAFSLVTLPTSPRPCSLLEHDSGIPFIRDDYQWLDLLIEERNGSWMEEENS